MTNRARYPFVAVPQRDGNPTLRPLLPFTLQHDNESIQAVGMLDTGADVNVLPFELGLSLGFDWSQQSLSIKLGGNLSQMEARIVIVTATVATFPAVPLVFAWTQSRVVPLILGQANFFLQFNTCFYRAAGFFEIEPNNET
jgi:hypothetical protein